MPTHIFTKACPNPAEEPADLETRRVIALADLEIETETSSSSGDADDEGEDRIEPTSFSPPTSSSSSSSKVAWISGDIQSTHAPQPCSPKTPTQANYISALDNTTYTTQALQQSRRETAQMHLLLEESEMHTKMLQGKVVAQDCERKRSQIRVVAQARLIKELVLELAVQKATNRALVTHLRSETERDRERFAPVGTGIDFEALRSEFDSLQAVGWGEDVDEDEDEEVRKLRRELLFGSDVRSAP